MRAAPYGRRGFVLAAFVVALTTNAPAAQAPLAALWEQPTDLADRDLYDGPWGAAHAPDPRAVYTLVRPKKGGTNPGLVMRDPAGRTWHVKQAPHTDQGSEGPVEVVISRVLSAIGYHQPPVYFLPAFTMIDDHGRSRIEPGGRFRLDEPSLRHRGTWSWTANPFVGTQPFNGLLTVLLVFNSWDLKDSNNSVYDAGGREWYVVRDLGGALGEEGRMRPTRNDVNRFERGDFIKGVAGGCVEFAYKGKRTSLIDRRVPVEDVSWGLRLLSGLNDRQWRDAFRAGGYAPSVADRFINKIRAKIRQGLALDLTRHEASGPFPPPRRP